MTCQSRKLLKWTADEGQHNIAAILLAKNIYQRYRLHVIETVFSIEQPDEYFDQKRVATVDMHVSSMRVTDVNHALLLAMDTSVFSKDLRTRYTRSQDDVNRPVHILVSRLYGLTWSNHGDGYYT